MDYKPKFKEAYASVTAAMVTHQAVSVTRWSDTHKRSRSQGCVCGQCGTIFYASRYDAKYCSSLCRKAASRRKEQMKRMADRAIGEIETIKQYMKDFEDLDIFGSLQLDRIRDLLKPDV